MAEPVRFAAAVVRAVLVVMVATASTTPARADSLDAYIARQMTSQHIPGLSLAVIDHGRTVKLKSYGKANLELGTPMTPDSVIDIGSLTKSFTAAAVMLLVQDRKVALDDPIDRYLEETPPIWRGITIRQLLNHSSGLATDGIPIDAETELADFSESEFLASAAALPLQAAPGTTFAYSNLGYGPGSWPFAPWRSDRHVLAYRIKGDLHDAEILVFLTPAGLIADTDLSTE